MKKFLPLTATFILSIIIIWIFGAIVPGNSFKIKKHIEKISISNTRGITLDFHKANEIQVLGWNKNEVEVQINNRIYHGNKTIIEANDNHITLKSGVEADRHGLITQTLWPWLPLLQFERYRKIMTEVEESSMESDFIIYLPKETPVDIHAGKLTVRNCRLAYLSAASATVRSCTFLKGFSGTTGEVSVRDSIISNDMQLNSQSSNFENNKYSRD